MAGSLILGRAMELPYFKEKKGRMAARGGKAHLRGDS